MRIYQSNYKGYKIEVYTVETTKKDKVVFDILVNDGYYGTAFDLMKACEYLARLRGLIDKGETVWDTTDSTDCADY